MTPIQAEMIIRVFEAMLKNRFNWAMSAVTGMDGATLADLQPLLDESKQKILQGTDNYDIRIKELLVPFAQAVVVERIIIRLLNDALTSEKNNNPSNISNN